MKKKVHVSPHTHWDREWYFNTSRSTIYLIKHIKEVLNTLENNASYSYYLLDAQTSLVDDYLEYHPEDLVRIEKLVSEGRLIVGPWVTQSDQLVISQESVVRNLFYGLKRANELGKSQMVGYVPDAFGQGGNMPQVYKSFGMNFAIFWRGVADNRIDNTEFIWRGTDGSEVLSHIMRNGYSFGGKAGIPNDKDMIGDYLDKFVGTLEEISSSKNIYLPYGHDQSEIRENLPELIESFNDLDPTKEYVLSSVENYFKDLERDDVEKLDIVEGELTQGKHSRIHKSIFSTRADMKIENNKIENFLVNELEPILLIADSLGIEYPHSVVEKIWKLMFESAAHDSIGGCNSDSTNRDILQRYKNADDLAKNLLEITVRQVANKIHTDGDINFVVFNPLPYKVNKLVNIEAFVPSLSFELIDSSGKKLDYIIEESQDMTEYMRKQIIKNDPSESYYLPDQIYKIKLKVHMPEMNGLGYETIQLIESEVEMVESENYGTEIENKIENEYYIVEVNNDNTINIFDKESGEKLENQMVFTESGDAGDSYNYSPPRKDLVINSIDAERISLDKSVSDIESSIKLVINMRVPKDLKNREEKKCDSNLKLQTTISLHKGEKLIRFKTDVENNVLSHKLSVQFNTKYKNNYSYADHMFGPIKRPVILPENKVWEEEDWEEKPISVEPMQTYAALSSEKEMLSVLTNGVREYEVVGEYYNKLQLTLFRTFGQMGREDLLYRPGRSSGETIVKTPDAQLLGNLEFEYALYFDGNKSISDLNLSKITKEYLTELQSYQKSDFINGRMFFVQKPEKETLNKSYSLLDMDLSTVGISALKKSEDNKNLILRVFNPYMNKTVEIPEDLKVGSTFVKLDEKTKETPVSELEYNKFVTIRKEIT